MALIKVVAIGDGAIAALHYMVREQLAGIDYIGINTYASPMGSGIKSLIIGKHGAGGSLHIGQKAAERHYLEIREALLNSRQLVIISALGGGTGSGGVATIARIAQGLGIESFVIVSLPFSFEGTGQRKTAQAGLQLLRHFVDEPVIVQNDHLADFMNKFPTEQQLFSLAARALAWQGLAYLGKE